MGAVSAAREKAEREWAKLQKRAADGEPGAGGDDAAGVEGDTMETEYTAHVPLPNKEEIEKAVLERRKQVRTSLTATHPRTHICTHTQSFAVKACTRGSRGGWMDGHGIAGSVVALCERVAGGEGRGGEIVAQHSEEIVNEPATWEQQYTISTPAPSRPLRVPVPFR